jgi:hypothetical protein
MKHVFKESMVAYLWANKSQSEARNAGNTFFFADSTIFSYGSHFPIARHVTAGRGKEKRYCVLFTTDTRSVTTTGHCSTVRMAIAGDATVFNVPRLYAVRDKKHKWVLQHKDNIESYRKRISDLATMVLRARSNRDWLIRELNALVREANNYAGFFKLRTTFSMPTEADLKAETEAAAKAAKLAEKKRAESNAKYIAAIMNTDLPEWIAGGTLPNWNIQFLDKTYLRVRPASTDDGVSNEMYGLDVLETSKGAKVPLDHAIRILPLIRAGKSYQRNGHTEHVGHFALDSIDEQGNVKIGCHYVERDEIERIAAQLGL